MLKYPEKYNLTELTFVFKIDDMLFLLYKSQHKNGKLFDFEQNYEISVTPHNKLLRNKDSCENKIFHTEMEIKMNLIIRPMIFEDKDRVLEMMRVFYASPAVFTNGSDDIFRSDIENCINDNPYLEGYIFEVSGEIQGYGMIAKSFSTEFGRPCMWIEDIYIKESCRGAGIGSKFIDYIGEKYPDAILRLEVEEENERAVNVYKKNGFSFLPYLEMKK